MSEIVIRAKNLGKCYRLYRQPIDRLKQVAWRGRRNFFDEFWAINKVSFEIEKNETVGIIGSNGAGKSTILQLICGILTPSMGELETKGRVSSILELGSGFNPEFTGHENVLMNCAIMGLNRRETKKVYEKVVDFADIGKFIHQPVKTYSSGMYVRLAFASAINVSPDILLVDEALSVGDIRFQQKCIAKMKSFCKNGTVVFVSHDSSSILELCSRVIWIEGGTIRMDSYPKLVIEKYLEYMYEGDRPSDIPPEDSCEANPEEGTDPHTSILDGLAPITSKVRNFGNYSVTILAVGIRSGKGPVGIVYSGKPCEISLIFQSRQNIENPICGFLIKDRIGREIIGDNTALLGKKLPSLSKGKVYKLAFMIKQWPNLLGGSYTLSVAIANGRLEHHEQCQWLHDALSFESIPLRSPAGIFSILDTDVEFCNLSSQNILEDIPDRSGEELYEESSPPGRHTSAV